MRCAIGVAGGILGFGLVGFLLAIPLLASLSVLLEGRLRRVRGLRGFLEEIRERSTGGDGGAASPASSPATEASATPAHATREEGQRMAGRAATRSFSRHASGSHAPASTSWYRARLFKHDTKVEALRRAPLFEGLSKKELAQLARVSADMEIPEGTTLTKEGEIGHEFFVILEGETQVTRKGLP
jgi:hypothetical protein